MYVRQRFAGQLERGRATGGFLLPSALGPRGVRPSRARKLEGGTPEVRVSRLVVLRTSAAAGTGKRIHNSGSYGPEQDATNETVVDAAGMPQLLRGSSFLLLLQREQHLDHLLVPE